MDGEEKRAALERHHLFPKGELSTLGITDLRETNQIANFAMIEWGDNTGISDKPPADYVPVLRSRFTEREINNRYYCHALPGIWDSLEYQEFLIQQREMIAKVIADAYHRLAPPKELESENGKAVPIDELMLTGETTEVEFKSTLRVNMHTGEKDPRLELASLKTIAGFLNTKGGTLIIGLADDGTPLGVESDQFPNEDKMNLHLANLISTRMAPQHMINIHPRAACTCLRYPGTPYP